jgi:outer membrane cobalamin receptor
MDAHSSNRRTRFRGASTRAARAALCCAINALLCPALMWVPGAEATGDPAGAVRGDSQGHSTILTEAPDSSAVHGDLVAGLPDSSVARLDSTHPEGVPPGPFLMDTVFVRAKRPTRAALIKHHSAFANLIEVAGERAAGEGLADLLGRTAGIEVTHLGGPGMPATVSIRGAGPGEVEVFLDRIPLRSAARGSVDLNAIDFGRIAEVEVYRSAPPSDLGGQISSSVVRLVTRDDDTPGASVRVMAGSHGTREMTEILSLGTGAHRLLASLSRFSTTGDFRYFSDNGTEYEPADDAWLVWQNGEQVRQALFGRWRWLLGREAFTEISSQLLSREQGLPGTSQRPTEKVRFETSGTLHRFEIASGTRLRPARATFYGFHEATAYAFRDPLRELGMSGLPSAVDQDQTRRGIGAQVCWNALAARVLPGAHNLELLSEFGDERLEQAPRPGRPAEDLRARRSLVLSLGDHWDAFRGRARLSAFYRWDRAADNYTGSNPYRPFSAQPEHVSRAAGPRLGLRVTLPHGHVVKANYAHQARFPTFTELFGCEGTVRANAALEPEVGWQADVGWSWETGRGPLGMRLQTEHVFYTSRKEDMIVFMLVSDRETKPFNLERIRIDGYELILAADRLPGLRDLGFAPAAEGTPTAEGNNARLSLNLSWQDARDEGPSPVYHGKRLPYHPPLQARAALDLTRGRCSLGYASHYRAEAYWGRSNLPMFRTPSRWQHDLSARYRVARAALTLAVRVENLWDQQSEDIRGYPLPGRCWYGEIEWTPLSSSETAP